MQKEKIYQLYGINTAIKMLRPGAKWESNGSKITDWCDPRPCPSWEEVVDTMEKIKALEDSINTVWLPQQIEQIFDHKEKVEKALNG